MCQEDENGIEAGDSKQRIWVLRWWFGERQWRMHPERRLEGSEWFSACGCREADPL